MDYVPRTAWMPSGYSIPSQIRPTSELWVHHGAGGSATLATLKGYHRYHRSRGWQMLGYNWAITGDGTIYEGRGWLRSGAHTSGRNTISHAVLLVGDWSRGRVPDAMVEALAEVAREGHRVGALTTLGISGGHRQAPGQQTSCPGDAGLDAVRRARPLLDSTEEFTVRPEDEEIIRRLIREEAGRAVAMHRFPASGKGDGLDGASVQTALRRTARGVDVNDDHLRRIRRTVRAIAHAVGLTPRFDKPKEPDEVDA